MSKGILFCDGLFALGIVMGLLLPFHSIPAFLAAAIISGTVIGFAANHYNKLSQ